MKLSRIIFTALFACCLIFAACSSKNDITIPTENDTDLLAKFNRRGGKFLIIYNVDLIMNEDGKYMMKPREGYRYEYVNRYAKVNGDKWVKRLYAGSKVKNVNKVVIFVEGDRTHFLYYMENNKITILQGGALFKPNAEVGGECEDADDCYAKYDNPPPPLAWKCVKGDCLME